MIIRRLPSLPSWKTAFRDLDETRREMARLADSLSESFGLSGGGLFPAMNVFETAEAVVIRAEVPGIRPDDLDVSVENQTLTIAGERKMPEETGSTEASYHRREREWGSFRRSFTIPRRVDADGVRAACADGILTIELPKAAEARPRQIAVQAGA